MVKEQKNVDTVMEKELKQKQKKMMKEKKLK